MNNEEGQNKGEEGQKNYICTNCKSQITGNPGTCCNMERKEKCSSCEHAHKEDGSCDCGC